MKEKWKWIKGFEGLYEVSNKGRIKSYHKKESGYIMKGNVGKNGYKTINLRKNNQNYTKLIHRIIAKTFIPNTKNKREVNHKDFNKINNRIDNLEWVTAAENHKHFIKNCGIDRSDRYIPVVQIDSKTNEVINEFESMTEATKQTGIHSANISNVANKKRNKQGYEYKTAGGYKWQLKEVYYNED